MYFLLETGFNPTENAPAAEPPKIKKLEKTFKSLADRIKSGDVEGLQLLTQLEEHMETTLEHEDWNDGAANGLSDDDDDESIMDDEPVDPLARLTDIAAEAHSGQVGGPTLLSFIPHAQAEEIAKLDEAVKNSIAIAAEAFYKDGFTRKAAADTAKENEKSASSNAKSTGVKSKGAITGKSKPKRSSVTAQNLKDDRGLQACA